MQAAENATPKLDDYLERLRQLPFVRDVRALLTTGGTRGRFRRALLADPSISARLSIRTPSGTHDLRCFASEQAVHASTASLLLDRFAPANDLVVLAPYIGPTAARLFVEKHVNFVDLFGNCYLSLGEQYLARIEKAGAPPSKPAVGRGLRAPTYRALFALLVEPSAVARTTRAIAELAGGVSPQTVADLRAKLIARGLVLKRGVEHRWAPGGWQRALELWVHGFSTTLAPALELGRFRARQRDVDELTAALAPALERLGRWAWGGGAAASLLNGYYRGERTVVYLEHAPTNSVKQLGLVPDAKGPVLLAHSPGPLAFHGSQPHVAHPLLVYVDLLTEEHERASEAARVLYSDFLLPLERSA